MQSKPIQKQARATCLVVDDAPGVWHHAVVAVGKGMVAGPGGPKAVAHHLHTLVAAILQLLADVIGCQGGQGTTQGMPCKQPTLLAGSVQLQP